MKCEVFEKRVQFLEKVLLFSILTVFNWGCSDKAYRVYQDNILISSDTQSKEFSTAGNLVATAIKEVYDLDIVLYPKELLDISKSAILRSEMSAFDRKAIIELYPSGVKDQFLLGSMKGKDIQKLIIGRVNDTYKAEIFPAGIRYHIHHIGGILQYAYFNGERTHTFERDRYYRVAISRPFFFSGKTFPSYKYRNGMNFSMRFDGREISARAALKKYLSTVEELPFLREKRAIYTNFTKGTAGFKPIYEIQGTGHRSPWYGYDVTTRGIVTAAGSRAYYPGGYDFYIQDPKGDGRKDTSDALFVHLEKDTQALSLGDSVEVRGVVYEQMAGSGLGRTSLYEVKELKVLSRGNPLPRAILVGKKGRVIPHQQISTYKGNINLKDWLKLEDGIDFWESLEGMRIAISDPQIVGFRGGQEEFESQKAKGHLSLYLVSDALQRNEGATLSGGIILDYERGDYNPEIIHLSNNHLTKGIDTKKFFNVGDFIPGELTGVLSFEKNIFGGGEYTFVLPEVQSALSADFKGKGNIPLSERPQTNLIADKDHLTVATYNVENLGGNQDKRLREIAKSVAINLKCPDILNLVEIQDDNGVAFGGGSSAALTLKRLINYTKCPVVEGKPVEYVSVNIDPVNHSEGGQPGGNIRVVMIYNANRVEYFPRGKALALSENRVNESGLLYNPGRVFPNDSAFKGSRKSLAVEFIFKGHKIVLIGNHWKSKLGDASLWGNQQPPVLTSDKKRQVAAERINFFVELLERFDPQVHVIVLGDLNAVLGEPSLKILEGNILWNLMTWSHLVSENDRYTTNHNGNSQPLDYIFVNRNFLKRNPELEILHINSDFMGRLSDHDPLIAKFRF